MTQTYPSRRKSRKHAVEIGYAALVREANPVELLGRTAAEAGWRQHPWYAYTEEIVDGVGQQAEALDTQIAAASTGRKLERMQPLDVAILRVAAWELANKPDLAAGIVISEATHLADELSGDETPKFVQGILSQLAAGRDAVLAATSETDGSTEERAEL